MSSTLHQLKKSYNVVAGLKRLSGFSWADENGLNIDLNHSTYIFLEKQRCKALQDQRISTLRSYTVRATAERLSRDLAGDPKHIYKHKYDRKRT